MNNSSPLDEMSKCNSLTPAGRHEADWAGFEKLIPPEDKTFSARCMLIHVFQCPVVYKFVCSSAVGEESSALNMCFC